MVQRFGRPRQADHQHAGGHRQHARPRGQAQRLAEHGGTAQRHQQRRAAPHDRVGGPQVAMLVGAVERQVVGDVHEQGGADEGPGLARRHAEQHQQRQGRDRTEKVHQRDVEFLVAAGLDQRIPAGMQQGAEEDRQDDEGVHAERRREPADSARRRRGLAGAGLDNEEHRWRFNRVARRLSTICNLSLFPLTPTESCGHDLR
jgi:hypothetical protein